MKTKQYIKDVTVLGVAVVFALMAWAPAGAETGLQAPLFDNLGNHHYSITTDQKLSQRFFNQGLVLAYGFNHLEAARSFGEAYRLDADCAMGYWGQALVLGPNINAAMEDEAVPKAFAAVQKP